MTSASCTVTEISLRVLLPESYLRSLESSAAYEIEVMTV